MALCCHTCMSACLPVCLYQKHLFWLNHPFRYLWKISERLNYLSSSWNTYTYWCTLGGTRNTRSKNMNALQTDTREYESPCRVTTTTRTTTTTMASTSTTMMTTHKHKHIDVESVWNRWNFSNKDFPALLLPVYRFALAATHVLVFLTVAIAITIAVDCILQTLTPNTHNRTYLCIHVQVCAFVVWFWMSVCRSFVSPFFLLFLLFWTIFPIHFSILFDMFFYFCARVNVLDVCCECDKKRKRESVPERERESELVRDCACVLLLLLLLLLLCICVHKNFQWFT